MNRINYYTKNLYMRDYIFKINPKNILNIPTFSKIVLHTTINNSQSNAIDKKKILLPHLAIEMISGQKPFKTRAKKFVATFKVKKNQLLGYKVTLRNNQMFSFFEKFLNIVLPKIRDFQGFKHISDKKGGISFGFQNFLFFSELENYYELFEPLSGLQITFLTTSKNTDQIYFLLSMYEVPFLNRNLY